MILGTTKNLGVIGWPVAHSLSPAIQNAAIREAGIDYAYIAMPVKPDFLAEAVRGAAVLGFRGFNVTIPHKTAIIPLLDEIDGDAASIGAVNTVLVDGGKLRGFNTDVKGFIEPLRKIKIFGKEAAVLGAGGAARAVIRGLKNFGFDKITVGVRNVEKARKSLFFSDVKLEIFDWNEKNFLRQFSQSDLIVNTTPIGMTPNTEAMAPVNFSSVQAGAVVYDIIYTPEKTKFLLEAEKSGLKTISGAEMLVDQGAASFEIWTGISPNRKIMMETLKNMLTNFARK